MLRQFGFFDIPDEAIVHPFKNVSVYDRFVYVLEYIPHDLRRAGFYDPAFFILRDLLYTHTAADRADSLADISGVHFVHYVIGRSDVVIAFVAVRVCLGSGYYFIRQRGFIQREHLRCVRSVYCIYA